MLRLLDIFWVKNSRPFFSKLVRVRASNLYTLLIGIIKPYHYHYRYFLLRSLVSEKFAGPFHQAKAVSSSFTVPSIKDLCWSIFCPFVLTWITRDEQEDPLTRPWNHLSPTPPYIFDAFVTILDRKCREIGKYCASFRLVNCVGRGHS